MGKVPYYRPVCRDCLKRAMTSSSGSRNGGPPNKTPMMSGHCTCSVDGKHHPIWEPV
jgi:hypothetical protein